MMTQMRLLCKIPCQLLRHGCSNSDAGLRPISALAGVDDERTLDLNQKVADIVSNGTGYVHSPYFIFALGHLATAGHLSQMSSPKSSDRCSSHLGECLVLLLFVPTAYTRPF